MSLEERYKAQWFGKQKDQEDVYDLEKSFVLGEGHLKSEDVRQFARELIVQFKNNRTSDERIKEQMIVDVFTESKLHIVMAEYLITLDDEITSSDLALIDSVLQDIRKVVIDELKNHLDEDDFLLVDKYLKEKEDNVTLIAQLHGEKNKDKVLRRIDALANSQIRLYPDEFANYQKGLQMYADLCKKGDLPESLLPFYEFDGEELTVLTKKVNLSNFEVELMARNYSNKELVQVILDAVSGCSYLLKNELALQDISSDNIGIDKDTGRGLLFDLDLIYPEGAPRRFLFFKDDTVPPEHNKKKFFGKKKEIASYKEMIYQLGVVISDLLNTINRLRELEPEILTKLVVLKQKMTAKNPKKRPEFVEIMNDLEIILQSLPSDLIEEKEQKEAVG